MNLLNLGKAAAVLGLVATPSSAKSDTVINESKEVVVGEEAAGKDQVITLQQLAGGGIFSPIPLQRLIEDLIQPFFSLPSIFVLLYHRTLAYCNCRTLPARAERACSLVSTWGTRAVSEQGRLSRVLFHAGLPRSWLRSVKLVKLYGSFWYYCSSISGAGVASWS